MKIGIITVPFNNNYGGFLQAYALKSVIQSFGNDVIFINRCRNRRNNFREKIKGLLIYLRIIKDKKQERINALSVNTNRFKLKYLEPITEEYYTTKQLKKCLNEGFDCFVVGSDQVWRYAYAKDSIDNFFFDFLKNTGIRRISYAASFGIDKNDYPLDKIKKCSELLKEFAYISVREDSGVDLLANYFSVPKDKVNVVLDPTFLLDKNIYISLFRNIFALPKIPYLFTYILDDTEEKFMLVDYVKSTLKLERKDLKAQTGKLSKLSPLASVEEWLFYIYYSDFVITDSFHGTVFSIIFNKPFIVYGNVNRGKSRFISLLKKFNLERNYLDSLENFDIDLIRKNIDWDDVNCRIHNLRKYSMIFLEKALNNNI